MSKDGQQQHQQKLVLFACAAAFRLLLTVAFPSLPDFLTDRVEISTPVTSFKRCEFPAVVPDGDPHLTDLVREGLYLYNHGVSPYDGGVFHQASEVRE